MPDLADGLWPAFWTLGNNFSQVGWPFLWGAGTSWKWAVAQPEFPQEQPTGVSASTAHWDNDGGYASYGRSFDAPLILTMGSTSSVWSGPRSGLRPTLMVDRYGPSNQEYSACCS